MLDTLYAESKTAIVQKAVSVYSALRRTRPMTRAGLKNYIKVFLGIDVPDKRICDGHCSPLDYLWHAYSVDFADSQNTDRGQGMVISPPINSGGSVAGPASAKRRVTHHTRRENADCIVWANRGGGKTELAAVATLLDCIFKPACQVRILGGSGEQSARMYDYLVSFINTGFACFTAGAVLKSKVRFTNASAVEVLTQSATSVRGQHINKLRCDEVELFDRDVFEAAKFTTQSSDKITAAMELISTMHRPYGLMGKIVDDAPKFSTPIFKWCLFETLEKCTDRSCSRCPLDTYCRGRAKDAVGYLKIDDCISFMRRASRAGFETEMLCARPSLDTAVFDRFNPDIHVKSVEYNPDLPLYRSLDFGFVNPFVCLWIQVDGDGVVRVIDEYVKTKATIDIHAEKIKQRTPCAEEAVIATFCDPAGAGRNDITGTSAVRELRQCGIRVRYRRSSILEGIELIRRAIRAGDGQSSLVISPRCGRLIEALRCYHYPDTGCDELPVKDGIYDHPIDALRYFFINYKSPAKPTTRRY